MDTNLFDNTHVALAEVGTRRDALRRKALFQVTMLVSELAPATLQCQLTTPVKELDHAFTGLSVTVGRDGLYLTANLEYDDRPNFAYQIPGTEIEDADLAQLTLAVKRQRAAELGFSF
jgi:hypothetical protein